MKKFDLTIIGLLSLLASCNNESLEVPLTNEKKSRQEIKNQPSFFYDEIYEIRNGKEINLTFEQKIKNPVTRATSTYEFYEVTTVMPSYIYTGSVLTAASINSDRYNIAGVTNELKEAVTISFSLPRIKSMTIAPKKSIFTDAVHTALANKDFSGAQSQVISYKMKEFSYYNEVKLAFGANVNVAGIFSFDTNINSGKTEKKTGLYVDFSQVYFNVTMDIPDDGNIYRTESIRQKYLNRNPVYISSVNYGRKGIIVVESNYNYAELSVAIRAAFNAKIVNGELSLDAKTKAILNEASIIIYILGGSGEEAAKTVQGFAEFQNYIVKGGVYTKEIHGVPISFGGSYAADNSMFISQFSIDF